MQLLCCVSISALDPRHAFPLTLQTKHVVARQACLYDAALASPYLNGLAVSDVAIQCPCF